MAQTPVPTPTDTVKLMTGDSGLTFPETRSTIMRPKLGRT